MREITGGGEAGGGGAGGSESRTHGLSYEDRKGRGEEEKSNDCKCIYLQNK